MKRADERNTPVKAKAILIDPATMTAVWVNEAVAQFLPDSDVASGITIEQVVPMAEAMGAAEALRLVAETGVPRHMQADLVSTSQGALALVTSIYRLPDGMLLVLTDETWQSGRPAAGVDGAREPARRRR